MRFVLVILIWFLIVGGLGIYFSHRDRGQPLRITESLESVAVTETYDLFITPTFDVEADPFALNAKEAMANAFLVQLNGQKIPLDTETFQRGVRVGQASLANLNQGINEIYVKANPPIAEAHLEHGVRVVLAHEDEPIADQTLWSRGGGVVSGTVTFKLETPEAAHEH